MTNSVAVAVVTGANKGIGYAVVEGLTKAFKGIIYLTARNERLGKEAIEKLSEDRRTGWKCEGLLFHQLDISDPESVKRFERHLKDTHGGLDILINNAAIAYKVDDTTSFAIQAENTLKVNYFGTLDLTDRLLPLIRANGRVVNVSSRAGLPNILKSTALYDELMNDSLSISELNGVVARFVQSAKDESLDANGFPHTAYGMSKLALTLSTFCLQRELDRDRPADKILAVPCCPGYVDTDMTSHKGHKTPQEGADTPVFLATLPPDKIESFKFRMVCERQATVFK